MRPHQYYKNIFHQCVADLDAASLLDVGCGSGEWVAELRDNGMEAHGIETSSSIALGNPFLSYGSAEDLPYPDNSVDIVTSEFSAHHFADLGLHLKEATRVAKKAVAILDPWYDDTIPSQRTARTLDEWFKTIDRSVGQIHHNVISSAGFLNAMPTERKFAPRFQTLLKLEDIPEEKRSALYEEYAAKCNHDVDRMTELTRIQALARKNGLSQDGALIFIAEFE